MMAKHGLLGDIIKRINSHPDEIHTRKGPMLTTPLMEAADGNNFEVVKLFLNNHASLHLRDTQNASCVHHAAASSADSLALMLNHTQEIQNEIHRQDLKGDTPLHWAARKGLLPCCQLLLAAGGAETLKIKNYDGQHPDELAQVSPESNNATREYLKQHKQG